MIKIAKPVGVCLLLAVALGILVSKGCQYFPESTFQLAKDSRLPKWIALPSGFTRADVTASMNYYSLPWGSDTDFVLKDTKGKVLSRTDGKVGCRKPFELKDTPEGTPYGYPNYEAVTINGITEIFEQRKPEPILYVTDDSAVWKRYREFCAS